MTKYRPWLKSRKRPVWSRGEEISKSLHCSTCSILSFNKSPIIQQIIANFHCLHGRVSTRHGGLGERVVKPAEDGAAVELQTTISSSGESAESNSYKLDYHFHLA